MTWGPRGGSWSVLVRFCGGDAGCRGCNCRRISMGGCDGMLVVAGLVRPPGAVPVGLVWLAGVLGPGCVLAGAAGPAQSPVAPCRGPCADRSRPGRAGRRGRGWPGRGGGFGIPLLWGSLASAWGGEAAGARGAWGVRAAAAAAVFVWRRWAGPLLEFERFVRYRFGRGCTTLPAHRRRSCMSDHWFLVVSSAALLLAGVAEFAVWLVRLFCSGLLCSAGGSATGLGWAGPEGALPGAGGLGPHLRCWWLPAAGGWGMHAWSAVWGPRP